jgi:hypothetical protein
MAIEYKSDALGCASYKFLVMTEFGIFVFFNDNVYAIDGATVIPIGNDIKISLYNAATPIVIPSLETMGVISLHYFKKRNALCVVGKDYVYLYSIPNKRWMLYLHHMKIVAIYIFVILDLPIFHSGPKPNNLKCCLGEPRCAILRLNKLSTLVMI